MRGEIFYDSGELKYSGGTTTDPQAGHVYREGYGIEYYEDGTPKTVGTFQRRGWSTAANFTPMAASNRSRHTTTRTMGSIMAPYPVTGTFFDEEGQVLHSGPFTISRSGIGWPRVIEPEGYGVLD